MSRLLVRAVLMAIVVAPGWLVVPGAAHAAEQLCPADRGVILIYGTNSSQGDESVGVIGNLDKNGDAIWGSDSRALQQLQLRLASRGCITRVFSYSGEYLGPRQFLKHSFIWPRYTADDVHAPLATIAEHLSALMQQMRRAGSREFDVIGFSLGGLVAAYWAATTPDRPGMPGIEGLHSLISIDSPIGGRPGGWLAPLARLAPAWVDQDSPEVRRVTGAQIKITGGSAPLAGAINMVTIRSLEDAVVPHWTATLKEMDSLATNPPGDSRYAQRDFPIHGGWCFDSFSPDCREEEYGHGHVPNIDEVIAIVLTVVGHDFGSSPLSLPRSEGFLAIVPEGTSLRTGDGSALSRLGSRGEIGADGRFYARPGDTPRPRPVAPATSSATIPAISTSPQPVAAPVVIPVLPQAQSAPIVSAPPTAALSPAPQGCTAEWTFGGIACWFTNDVPNKVGDFFDTVSSLFGF